MHQLSQRLNLKALLLAGLMVTMFLMTAAQAATTPQLACGSGHVLMLFADGTVKAWGHNASGELGNGTLTESVIPVPVVGLGGAAIALAAGYSHSAAILADGTVKTWGGNYTGQLGDGTQLNNNVPVTVTGLNGPVVAIAAGTNHTLALLADGTVQAWGANTYGQLGDGTMVSSLTPVSVVGLGGPVKAIAAGGAHSVALMADGSVKSWGQNDRGQLGIGILTPSSLPVTVGFGTTVTAISAGEFHTVALLANGTIKTCGGNSHGQLGNGTTTNSKWPLSVGVGGTAVAMAGGAFHTLAVLSDGTVKAWGNNFNGELGSASTTNKLIPTSVIGLGGKAVAVDGGNSYTVVALADGSVKMWGRIPYLADYALAIPDYQSTPVSVVGITKSVTELTAGMYHTMARYADGTLSSWGDNSYGQLGNGTLLSSSVPVTITVGGSVTQIEAGVYHSIALLADGTVKTWGMNTAGQLGNGTNVNKTSPVLVTGLGGIVKAVAAGNHYSAALLVDGTVKTWGSNEIGQLGNGTLVSSNVPVSVKDLGAPAVAIATGTSHTMALLADGSIKCWGRNSEGQLGNGSKAYSTVPVTVIGLSQPAVAIAAGGEFSMALLQDGTVKAWGNNCYTIFGNCWLTQSSVPVEVTGLGGRVTALTAGMDVVIALLENGSLNLWGNNTEGQLGIGSTECVFSPILLDGEDVPFTAFTAGGGHTVLRRADNTVIASGVAARGQLGNGMAVYVPRLMPGNLDNAPPAVVVSQPAGLYHGSVTVELLCTDSFSGCDAIYYTEDGSNPTILSARYAGPLRYSESTVLTFFAVDKVGNSTPVQSVVYTLPPNVSLEVAISGEGTVHTSPAPDMTCNHNCAQTYEQGSTVSLTAVPAISSSFTGWGGACSGLDDCTLTMDVSKNVTAIFSRQNSRLVVVKTGSGNGTVTSVNGISCRDSCLESYPYASTAILTAHADTGSTFIGWSGACSGAGNCELSMDADKNVVALFQLDSYPLTVLTSGSGMGNVVSSPAGITCGSICSESFDYGTVLTLNATAAPGSTFVGWSGACSGSGSCTVSMDGLKNVSALFAVPCAPISGIYGPTASMSGSYVISWGASATAGVTYLLYENGAQIYSGPNRSFAINGKGNGTYTYTVKAIRAPYLESPLKGTIRTVVALTCGKVPSISVLTYANGLYQVRWGGSTTTGVTYELYENSGSGWSLAYSGPNRYLNVAGKVAGTYQYKVLARKFGYAPSVDSNIAMTTVTP